MKSTSLTHEQIEALVKDDYIIKELSKISLTLTHKKCNTSSIYEISKFMNGTRCPVCAAQKAEAFIEDYLTQKGIAFKRPYIYPISDYSSQYALLKEDHVVGVIDLNFIFKGVAPEKEEKGFWKIQLEKMDKKEYCLQNKILYIPISSADLNYVKDSLDKRSQFFEQICKLDNIKKDS